MYIILLDLPPQNWQDVLLPVQQIFFVHSICDLATTYVKPIHRAAAELM
jgi:hypothetical protein